jgi:hypothetical protein
VIGCHKAEPTSEAAPVLEGEEEARPGRLGATNGLALGTLELEGSARAVTPAQAAELLPLWQMIGSGSLQGAAETDAVLAQIEGVMTEDQLSAIDAMGLAFEDMGIWIEEQGIEMPERAGPGPGGFGPGQMPGDVSEDERAALREQFQALRELSAEERATRMAEMGIQRSEGQGGEFDPGDRTPRGAPGNGFLIDPLVELLTERAGE